MDTNIADLIISATEPASALGRRLSEAGALIIPLDAELGHVERYVVSDSLAIERRTSSTFMRGIMDKTLFTSAIFLREHFRIPILIVEGELNYAYSMVSPQAIRGALSSMMLEYGISVLSTANLDETAELVAMMIRQNQVGIPEISLIPKRKAVDLPDMQRRVVEMLPGCGMVMARHLLQHFGSVARLVGADEDELRQIKGIGKTTARQIRSVLQADYESIDTEKELETAIEVCPTLLFPDSVCLLARQHFIFSDAAQRHIIDLIGYNHETHTVILVELKRGLLLPDHERQLQCYLDHAHESPLVRTYLDDGADIHGMLATMEQCNYRPKNDQIGTRIVDKQTAIHVLKALRSLGSPSER